MLMADSPTSDRGDGHSLAGTAQDRREAGVGARPSGYVPSQPRNRKIPKSSRRAQPLRMPALLHNADPGPRRNIVGAGMSSLTLRDSGVQATLSPTARGNLESAQARLFANGPDRATKSDDVRGPSMVMFRPPGRHGALTYAWLRGPGCACWCLTRGVLPLLALRSRALPSPTYLLGHDLRTPLKSLWSSASLVTGAADGTPVPTPPLTSPMSPLQRAARDSVSSQPTRGSARAALPVV